MLITFEGVQGSGKTTAAVAFAYEEYLGTGRKVISNNHLQFPFQKFSLEFFLEHLADHEMEDCVLFIDEMYQMADSRSSASKLNKVFTYFAVQTRKRGVDMYLCTHHLDHIDLRLRRAVDMRCSCRYSQRVCPKCKCTNCKGRGVIGSNGTSVKCSVCDGQGGTGYDRKTGKPCQACIGYGIIGWVRMRVLDRRRRRRYTPPDILSNQYWHLFNSWDRIPMPAKTLQGIDTVEVW